MILKNSGMIAQRLSVRIPALEGAIKEAVDSHNTAVHQNRAALDASLTHDALSIDDINKLTAAKLLKFRDERQAATFDLLRSRCNFASECADLTDRAKTELQAREVEAQKGLDAAWQRSLKGLKAIGVNADTARGGQQGLEVQIRQTPGVKEARTTLDQISAGIRDASSQRGQIADVQHAVDEDLVAFVKQMIG